jgi:23S rRNA (cytosine1962-C5)-methyltransferase
MAWQHDTDRNRDAFDYLRRAVQEGQHYGLVILDPPAFAKNKASLDGAARGYKEINLQALKLLEPGGVLATFSCSYWLSRERFLAILEDAAKDAGVRIRYLRNVARHRTIPVCPATRNPDI